MIIAPVVILVVSGFVALMISMVGDSLVTREQNNMTYETQDALDRIEQDTRLTTQFLTTSSAQTAPQGSDGNFTGTAAFSSSNSLILGNLTTDKNPTDVSRQLVFYANQPNDCGTQQSYNRPFQAKTIYFVKNGSLWRRSILPDYNLSATVNDSTTCAAPWQRNSCSPGYGASTRCQTNDTELMKNISTFNVKYLSTPDSTTDLGSAQALSANAIEVAITGGKTSKGRSITSTGTMRATKLNNIDVDLPVPGVPVVAASNSGRTATFTWPAASSATSYIVQYNINGGSWSSPVTLDNRTLSYNVDVGVNGTTANTATIRVAAKNSTGTSAYGTASTTMFEYGLVGWWRLNGDALDSSGNSYDGTAVNGPTTVIGAGGAGTTGMAFNGTNQYVNLGNPALLPSGTSARSMCAWARTTTVAAGYREIASYGSAVASSAMFITLNGTTLNGGGYGNDMSVTGYWSTSVWKHLCEVYNGSTATLYSNGASIGSGAFTWSLTKSKAYIGRQVNDAEYWFGAIDDVRVYKRALSAADVLTIYNGGAQ
jgi:hypothetical protein